MNRGNGKAEGSRRRGWLAACLLLIFLAVWTAGAAAEGLHAEVANPLLEVEAQIGYDGQITYGKLFPVRVTVRNHGADLEGTLAVNGYVNPKKYDRFETELSVPAGGERTVVLPVQSDSKQEVFTVEILRDGKVIAAVNVSPAGVIDPGAMLIGVLSSRPRNLANLDINRENDTQQRYEYWQTVALTPETLPDSEELLNSFGMMVLDDTDPASLTEKQRQAVAKWVRDGRVLLCGGGAAAPRNLSGPWNEAGLRAADFTVSANALPALEYYTQQRGSGAAPEVTLARIEGAAPLLADRASGGNGLIWRIPLGKGRVYVMAWEAGDPALNTQSTMHVFWQKLLLQEDPSLYNDIQYRAAPASAVYVPGAGVKMKVPGSLPAAAAVVAAGMVLGGALWFILRRRGATKWMWAILPVISLAAAAVIAVLAGSSALNSPVAMITVNTVQSRDGETLRSTAVNAAAPRIGLHRIRMDGENLEPRMYDDTYWGYEEDNQPKEPVTLRMVRISGDYREVAFNAVSPWQDIQLGATRPETEQGLVKSEIWMEEDGLHGTVENGTADKLREGAVICAYGFVRIPALAPGESADFVMLSEDAPDPLSPIYTDGKMLRNAPAAMYQVLNQMFYGGERVDYNGRDDVLNGMVSAAMDLVNQAYSQTVSSRDKPGFFYCAEQEGGETSELTVDGKTVAGKAVIRMRTVEINYLTVGKTGVVFRTPGMDTAVRCMVDGAGLPAEDLEENSSGAKFYGFYPLVERPTFRFGLESLEDVDISNLTIGLDAWYLTEAKCFLLNTKLRKWVEIPLNTPVERPEQYLDGKGNLYCQFRPVNTETYTDIPAPSLTLEGRVRKGETGHAAP